MPSLLQLQMIVILWTLLLSPVQPVSVDRLDSSGFDKPSRPVLYFHHLNDSACDKEKLVYVSIDVDRRRKVELKLLESSRDFLPPDATADALFGSQDAGSRPCFYQGQLLEDGSPAVAKLSRDSLFSATFQYNGILYEVPPQKQRGSIFPGRRLKNLVDPARRCPLATMAAAAASSTDEHSRSRRSALLMDTRSAVPQPEQKYIQLALVSDEAFFIGMGRDSAKAQDRLWEIGNYINSLYKQLGANVVTVRAIVLTSDPYTLENKTTAVSSTEMLDKFMAYRMQSLSNVQHSVAHLVSGLRMTGTDVGLAHLGKLCQFAYGGGVNSDQDMTGSSISVAVTVAHELGHNLGMNHDEDDVPCSCPDAQGCIMKAVGGDINPLRFSTCSVNRYLEFTVDTGLGYCMSRPAETSVKLPTDAPKCGNRIVEAGEDCDCGMSAWCNNSCCNPSTCKFSASASCASGQCCNISTCSLIAKGTMCRASRGLCDLPEYCNGSSEWCPEFDDFVLDGTPCAANPAVPTETQSYCYSSACVTRDSRCKEIFNGTDFRSAPEAAFNLTAEPGSSENGYCDYRPTAYNPVGYEYLSCSSENRRCGTLYCTGVMSESFPMPRWKSMAPADARTVMYSGGQQAVFAQLNLRPTGFRDPGLVPDGAECGAGMMCVNSRCTSVTNVRSNITGSRVLPNCNGRGNWTQSLQCFCNSGYRPPDCLQPGAGGSVTNQPAFVDSASTAFSPAATASVTTVSTIASSAIVSSSAVQQTSTATSGTTGATAQTTVAGTNDTGIYIGIGIAAAVIFLLIVAVVAYLLWKRCQPRSLGRSGGNASNLVKGGFDAGGPPAHLAEFYDSIRGGKNAGRKYWPPPPPPTDHSGGVAA